MARLHPIAELAEAAEFKAYRAAVMSDVREPRRRNVWLMLLGHSGSKPEVHQDHRGEGSDQADTEQPVGLRGIEGKQPEGYPHEKGEAIRGS